MFSEQLVLLQTKLILAGDHQQQFSQAAQVSLFLFSVSFFQFFKTHLNNFTRFLLFQDVVGVLAALRIKAIDRLRQYLLLKLQHLRRPLANYQLPQNALLKHK